jgi:hypothetical protein
MEAAEFDALTLAPARISARLQSESERWGHLGGVQRWLRAWR